MNQMMDGQGTMMWGMGWGGLVVSLLVIFSVAALIKYLFFDRRR